MNKKKILYIITKGNWGGAQRYVYDLAVHLPREEFEPVVACGTSGILTEKLQDADIKIVLLPSLQRDISFGKEFAAFRELLRLFKKEKPDIIHLNSSKAAFLGAIAARLFSMYFLLLHLLNAKRYPLNASRIVFTVHGWPFNEPRPAFIRALLWFASVLTALFASRVITLSQGDYTQGARLPFVVRLKLHLIRNGIAETKMLSREAARIQLNPEQEKPLPDFWIGVIAELNRNKGIGYLMEAFAQLTRPATLCIIGGGEERKWLETLAEKLSIADRVLFAGFREDAAQYLKAFDVFALPSLKEGLPYALLEAGAAALPVIATDLPGIREIIADETYGILVPPKNVSALAHAFTRLIENPAARSALGTALGTRIREYFPFPAMLKKTVGVYTNTRHLD